MATRQILALGGSGETEEQNDRIAQYLAHLTGKERPRVLFVPTASAEEPEAIVRFYARYVAIAEPSHLSFFPWPPDDLRGTVLNHDVVLVGGGNTANMLAIWRAHRFDTILSEAWAAGIVLSGVSAGMICWFEAGVTDSFGPQLEGMRDGLGFLPGSACPHYDGEDRRRPRYQQLVANGFPPGMAADDGVALHFTGTELAEAVTVREGARAYRVGPDGEAPIEARML